MTSDEIMVDIDVPAYNGEHTVVVRFSMSELLENQSISELQARAVEKGAQLGEQAGGTDAAPRPTPTPGQSKDRPISYHLNVPAGETTEHTEVTRTNVVTEARKVLKTKTGKEIDGFLLDMEIANVIVTVADKLSDESRAKLEKLDVATAAEVCRKVLE